MTAAKGSEKVVALLVVSHGLAAGEKGAVGQDSIAIESMWTPLKHLRSDGTVGLINDRSIKTRADLDRIIWPGEADMEERLQYIREYVAAVKGTGHRFGTY
jgi:hypothetical protein